MTDGYSSRGSCGEEVFHIPDDISTFTCTTYDTSGKCYCARPSNILTRIQDAAAAAVCSRHRSLISCDVPNKPIVDNYIGDKLRNGTSDSEKGTFLFFIKRCAKRDANGNLLEINTWVNELGSAGRSI